MRTRFIVALLFAALAPVSAFADPMTLDWLSPGDNPYGSYYVSPYVATVKGTGQQLTLYCIDFNHEVAPPTEWNAQLLPLDSSAVTLQYGNTGNAGVRASYETAAWLIEQLIQQPDHRSQAVYQYAAWEVFLDSAHQAKFNAAMNAVPNPADFAIRVADALAKANYAVTNGWTANGWTVVTPVPAGQANSTQEFLTSVPEPAAMLLLGTMVGGLLFVRRRYLA